MALFKSPWKVRAKIHSLDEERDAEILGKIGDNEYLARYDGVICTAIFNYFTSLYYLDDIYGVVSSDQVEKLLYR